MQLVVGLGMSGIGAALSLQDRRENWLAVEAEHQPGGWSRSWDVSGYRLDYGPHIMLDFDDELFDWMRLPDSFGFRRHTSNSVFFCDVDGRPFPVNLPLDENVSILPDRGGMQFDRPPNQNPTYSDHLTQTFGNEIASRFLIPYDQKRLCVDLDALPPKWNHRVLPNTKAKVGESSYFYPVDTGVGDLSKHLSSKLDHDRVRYGVYMTRLSLSRKMASFSDGSMLEFGELYSSIPLPVLLGLIEDSPFGSEKVRSALPYAQSYLTYLAVKGSWDKDYDFARFASKELDFHRMTVLSNYADGCCPHDEVVLMLETNFPSTSDATVTPKVEPEMMLKQLNDLGMFPKNTNLSFSHSEFVEHSAIFMNAETPDFLTQVHATLEDAGIHLIGKFGRWEDMLMGRALKSGIRAVEENISD